MRNYTPARYTSRPSTVEAVQWNGSNWTELKEFAGDKVAMDPRDLAYLCSGPDSGAQRWLLLPKGDWVLRRPGDETDYWPMGPRLFGDKYEAVDRDALPPLPERDPGPDPDGFAEPEGYGPEFYGEVPDL